MELRNYRWLLLGLMVGCASTSDDDDEPNDGLDWDQDGLLQSAEEAAGTDPFVADSDGDGYLDGEEVADGTDPLSEYSHSYIGGYNVGSDCPGFPETTGTNVGDYAANFTLTDQYGEEVSLYSFCGNTVMFAVGAFW